MTEIAATAERPSGPLQKGREFAEEDFQILQSCDEEILDLLTPQAAPTGSLEAMLNGGFAKVAFLKPLTPLAIAPSNWTV